MFDGWSPCGTGMNTSRGMWGVLLALLVARRAAAQCTDPTDADCFTQFLAARSSVDPAPECAGSEATDGSPVSGSWCRCAASLGGLDGSGDGFVGWIADGHCDRLFDTEACHEDGGDCTATQRRCHAALNLGGVSSACGFSEDRTGTTVLPQACSRGCAELFLPWFEECSWEEQIGGHPSWVWAGFEWACVLTLDSITTECVVDADTNPSAWSILQQCDGTCDCPDCDDETTCNYPTSICSDDERCSCNSGAMLPFAWVCDGVNDCGMGEDESVSSCGLKGVQAIEVFDATVETTGSNRLCANRWRDEVEASCGATDVASSQNMCSSACAAFYLSWFLDCKETIVGSAGDSHARVAIALNRRFMCCMHGTCTAEQHNNLVACDGSALVESLDDLADGECTASLNCAEFGRDGGDCDRRASARMQYTVAGPVGPDEFIAAVADNVRWLSAENVVVLKFHQTISGSIVLSSPTVAGVYMSRPASRTQLKRAIGRWLNVFADDVSIDDIHDVDAGDHGRRQRRRLQRDSRSVRVAFTVASEKDVTGPFDSTDKASAFRDILNEATPRVIDQLVALAPEDNVRFETDRLTVETEIVCFITVGYIEYELALGVQLPDFADLSTEIQLGLSDYVRIEQSLLERCGGSLCATSVLARPISLTIADLGRGNTIPAAKSPPEEEASLLGAAVAVVGGAICVYSLIICVQYGFRLKQSRALVVYSDGVQVGDFGTLADELQRQVLERLIDRWVMQEELKIEADCDASKKALTNEITGTMLKNPLLVPECHGTDANVGGPAKISERLLVQAMDADRAVPIANRSTRHQQAQARLTSARTNAAANLRATLQKAGIETDVIEELEEEVSAMDEYADAQIASLNSSLDQAEVQMLRGHGNDFATQIARAETEVSRRAIQDQYSALVAEELHKLATTRAQERLVLCDTLMARRAALAKTHEDALIDAVLDTRAQEQQDEQGRAKLQDLLTEMKQMHDSVADGAVATPDEHQDALGVVVLRAIVLQQEARSAGEIDYWAHYATRVQDEQQSVAEARRARRSEARERLVLARKLLVETRKTALAAQGAPNALMEDQFAETAAMQNEQDSQREEFEAEIEQKKKQQVLTKTAQFEAAMEACGSSAGREKLAATYATGLEVAYAQLESACAEQRAKLHARLGKRNEMLTEQHAKAMALMMTGNASGVHTATAQVEAREIALANASPQQYEYMKLLMEMEKPSATADDNSLAARRRLAQERLTGRRQAMNDRHRKELLNAGVPADMIDRHITDIELHDVFADREAEQVEEQAESEQRNVVANGGNPAVAEAQVANKRMKTRAKLRANLRARRSALGRKHRTELVRTAPTAVEVFEHQIAEREQLDSLLASAYVELASTRAELDSDQAAHHEELLRLQHDINLKKHAITTKALDLQHEFDTLVTHRVGDSSIEVLGGDDDIAPIMKDYTTCLAVIAQKTKGDVATAQRLQRSIRKKVVAMQFLAHSALNLIDVASNGMSSAASSRYSVSSGGRQGLPLGV